MSSAKLQHTEIDHSSDQNTICMLKFSSLKLSGMERHERVAKAIKESGLQKKQVAAACGVSNSAITQWINGDSKSLRPENLFALAELTGFSARWLAIGKGPERAQDEVEILGDLSPWDDSTPLDSDEVFIPLYKEVELAAGSGSTAVQEVTGRKIRFALSTLREAGVQPGNAVAAQAKGNSMERLILDGATIGIDRGTTTIIDGEIYAIDHDGMLRVKYLYRLPGGGLRLRSENEDEYPDEILDAEQAKSVTIIGFVFWWSTVRRRRGVSLLKKT